MTRVSNMTLTNIIWEIVLNWDEASCTVHVPCNSWIWIIYTRHRYMHTCWHVLFFLSLGTPGKPLEPVMASRIPCRGMHFGFDLIWLASNNYVSNNYVSNNHGPNNYVSNNYVSNIYVSNNNASNNYVSNNYVSNNYVSNNYVSNNYASNNYVSNNQVSNNYVSNNDVSNKYASNNYV